MTNNKQTHWAAQPERGSRLFLALTTLMVRYLPAFFMRPCIWFVVLYFYATAPKPRRHVLRYQTRLQTAFPHIVLPKHGVFKQFVAFGEAVCDRFAVWQRKIRYEDLVIEDPDDIYSQVKRNERGQIFACSHLGNTEVCRALVSHHKDFRLNVLVHSKHAQAFNEALQKAGADHIRLIQVTDLDTTLMMELNRRIEDGEWIAIAADRVPVRGEKTTDINFTLFCVKQNGRYHLKLRRFTDTSSWKRGNREAAVKDAMQGFADILAQECAQNPLQWFNFYDFWGEDAV